ncbi:hypothetical protein OXX79_000376 [Metschnikowia pulcherrima]
MYRTLTVYMQSVACIASATRQCACSSVTAARPRPASYSSSVIVIYNALKNRIATEPSMNHENAKLGNKRTSSSSGLGLGSGPAKKYSFGPDLSALPTHLPCASTPFASTAVSAAFSPEARSEKEGLGLKSEKEQKVDTGSKNEENNGISAVAPTSPGPASNTTETAPKSLQVEPEVEQKTSKSEKEPVFIEGTNITLQTEEDIAKWIAERKKRWPTRKNVEAKLSEQKSTPPKQEQNVSKHEQVSPKQNICKFYAKTKRCKFGNKCRNVHESGTSSIRTQADSATRKTINGVQVNIPQRYKKEVSGAGSLFTKLVQRDLYEHENNVIIDFIQYLESKGLISDEVKS